MHGSLAWTDAPVSLRRACRAERLDTWHDLEPWHGSHTCACQGDSWFCPVGIFCNTRSG